MTLQNINGVMAYPPHPIYAAAALLTSVITLDAANEKAAFIFRAPKTGDIAKLCFSTRAVVTGATVDVRLETVDVATGFPTGTLQGTNTNGSQVIQDADDNKWFATPLTSNANVTKGDLLAFVIAAPDSGTFDIDVVVIGDDYGAFPYVCSYTGSWAKSSIAKPSFALEYSDGSYPYIPGVTPHYSSTVLQTYNNTDTPDIYGLRFKAPFSARISGFWVWADLDANADIKLISGGSTTELSLSIDSDVWAGNDGRGAGRYSFDSDFILVKDTYYRLVLEPTTSTDISLYKYRFDDTTSPNIMSAVFGGGNCHMTSAKSPSVEGDWTNTTNELPMMGVFLDQFDDGAGGGGGRRPRAFLIGA